MNKKRAFLFTLLVLILGLGAIAIYRFNFRKSIPEASLALQVKAVLTNNGCLACHASDAEKPFYSNFPVAGKLVQQDMRNGLRYIDLGKVCQELEAGKPVSEVNLAKIEQSMINESMPLTKYKMIHWGTSYNDAEKDVLTRWVKETRAFYYPNSLAPENRCNRFLIRFLSIPVRWLWDLNFITILVFLRTIRYLVQPVTHCIRLV